MSRGGNRGWKNYGRNLSIKAVESDRKYLRVSGSLRFFAVLCTWWDGVRAQNSQLSIQFTLATPRF